MNRPGGNATGVTSLFGGLAAKQVGLLHDLVPAATLIGFLVNPRNPITEQNVRDALDAAQKLGEKIEIVHASSEAESLKSWTPPHRWPENGPPQDPPSNYKSSIAEAYVPRVGNVRSPVKRREFRLELTESRRILPEWASIRRLGHRRGSRGGSNWSTPRGTFHAPFRETTANRQRNKRIP
jgi:hypothetical protein